MEPFEYEDDIVYEVPLTSWGDYVGSTVERSNWAALQEDYPDTFIDDTGPYWSHRLLIPEGKLTEELSDIFKELQEHYPLYNDEHHSILEMDIAWEMWECYLKSDIDREWELDTDDWTEEDWKFVQQRYYALTYEQNYGPDCEDAVSAHFPFHDDVVDKLTEEINTLGLEHDPRRPNPNDPTLPGTEC